MTITLTSAKILPLTLTLNAPFSSSHAALKKRHLTLISLRDHAGHQAVGELEAFDDPGYNAETQLCERKIIQDYLLPQLKGQNLETLQPSRLWPNVSGHRMAKAAIETALWSLDAQGKQLSLAENLALAAHTTVRTQIPVGISLGLASAESLQKQAKQALDAGYSRIKVKVSSLADLAKIQALRQLYPTLSIVVDGNGTFTVDDQSALAQLDRLSVAMLEQPLAANAFLAHAKLQSHLKTALCLDEDILDLKDLQLALLCHSALAINLKPARVGGFSVCLDMLKLCLQHHLTPWVGGMVESDLGRYYSQSLAFLAPFTFPGDVGPAAQFFSERVTAGALPTLVNGALQFKSSPEPPKLTAELRQRFQQLPNLLI